ncbi:hypothetical protein MHU86_24301 [Fragilaria crotonensis]|nr:hypothetical protein MHU86_24301 [Fragilaria crotonensis]
MTMTDGTALVIPSAYPKDWDPLQPLEGFQCDNWLPHPTIEGPDWFSSEERARREANAYAYRQKGTKSSGVVIFFSVSSYSKTVLIAINYGRRWRQIRSKFIERFGITFASILIKKCIFPHC